MINKQCRCVFDCVFDGVFDGVHRNGVHLDSVHLAMCISSGVPLTLLLRAQLEEATARVDDDRTR